MAVRLATVGARDLLLAAPLSKGRNWATAITIDGAANQYGLWRGIFVQLPTAFDGGQWTTVHGSDVAGFGNYNSGNDYYVSIGTDNNTDVGRRRRAMAAHGSGGLITVQIADTVPQMALGATHLIVDGVSNTSAVPGSPVWVHWLAVCEVGTSNIFWASAPVVATSQPIVGTGGFIARQVFERFGTATQRTLPGTIAEHLALAQGNFPWDTANNRPHFDAIAALAGGGAGPFHTYESLVAAQNAGTLGYANLLSSKSDLDYWWRLADLAALDNWTGAQSAGANAFATDPAGAQTDVVDHAAIAPAHWANPALAALGLSSSNVATGSPVSIAIAGRTAGSTISLQSGSLPTGLVLDSAAGTISGTPTTSGAFAFTLRETLGSATNSPRDTALQITAAVSVTLAALTVSPGTITQGAAATLNIAGATSGSTITLQSGTLPAGLTLDSAARTITGTPGAAGAFAFTLRETLAGATNSPRDSGVAIQVNAPSAAVTISAPAIRFHGGRGQRALVVGGTFGGTTTAVQRRWVVEAGGAVVPGFDWASTTASAGSWSLSDTLPVGGPYRLDVRDAADVANSAASTGWLVGTSVLVHGQSGMELALRGAGAAIEGPNIMGTNFLGLAVAAGVRGVLVKLSTQRAVDSGGINYRQPQIMAAAVNGGTTPTNVNQGAIAVLNEWHAHVPGHPLLICNMAIDGTSMVGWANNDAPDADQPSWRFMGQIGAVAGPASGNDSGVVESYAAALGRYVDCHAIMWTPGMSGIATGAGSRELYRQGIDARFSNAGAAPWLVLPPWRGHREPFDSSATTAKRREHLEFQQELGARGILGPTWLDTVMDNSTGLHAAIANPAGTPAFSPIADTNVVGASRIGFGLGRALAWVFDRRVKAVGPQVISAWFRDGDRLVIEIELGRRVRTINNAAILNLFWVSVDNGASWSQAGFAVALSPDATRAVLTKDAAPAWPAVNVRVDYARNWPLPPSVVANEATVEPLLYGLLYDDQQYRGANNLPAGDRAGNALFGTNRTGAGSAGVPVAARGPARLVATERFTGTRNVTVRLMSPDGATVLRERVLTVTAN